MALDHVEVSQIKSFVTSLPQKGVPVEEVPGLDARTVSFLNRMWTARVQVEDSIRRKLEYELVGTGKANIDKDGIHPETRWSRPQSYGRNSVSCHFSRP